MEADEFDGPDFDRPLTDAGRKLMALEADAMAALALDLDAIVTSPLVRAKQTAAIVAKALKLRERLVEDDRVGLGFGPGRLAEMIAERSGASGVMFVGHEPSMSATIGHLIGGDVEMKKGSLACVNLTAAPASGYLVWLVTAKILALGAR